MPKKFFLHVVPTNLHIFFKLFFLFSDFTIAEELNCSFFLRRKKLKEEEEKVKKVFPNPNIYS